MQKLAREIILLLIVVVVMGSIFWIVRPKSQETSIKETKAHWFLLQRKSNVEYLYLGVPGDKRKSMVVKRFRVKTGMPGERPTPLPQLIGRDFWILTKKESSSENPETAPYFLTLNVPVSDEAPFGPSPYKECGQDHLAQCNWELPGAFGLHGINGDETRLSKGNPGSSGCIRHSDKDISYLYNLLNPQKEEIRYYIEDK